MRIIMGLLALAGAYYFLSRVWKTIVERRRRLSDQRLFDRVWQTPAARMHVFLRSPFETTFHLHEPGQALGSNQQIPVVSIFEQPGFFRYQVSDGKGTLRFQWEENTRTGKKAGRMDARTLGTEIRARFLQSCPLDEWIADASDWLMVSGNEARLGEWSLRIQREDDDNERMLELAQTERGICAVSTIYEPNMLSLLWKQILAANQSAAVSPEDEGGSSDELGLE